MDRQPGWRLAIIVWGLLCPAAIDTGAGLWVLFVQGSRVPWFTLPETAAYSMIAAMPMAVLTARSVRRRGKIIPRAGQGREGLAWITIGYLLIMTVPALNLYLDQQRYFPHIHRVVGAVTVLLVLSGLACWAAGGKLGSRHSGAAPNQAAGTELLVPAPDEPFVHNG
jgi:hypothetical protein